MHQQVGSGCSEALLLGKGFAELVALMPLIRRRKEADMQPDSQLHAKLSEMQLCACGGGCSVLPAVLPIEVQQLWTGRSLRHRSFIFTEGWSCN